MDSNNTSTPLRILLVEDSEHDWLAFRRAFQKSQVASEITRYVRTEEALERLIAGPSAGSGQAPSTLRLRSGQAGPGFDLVVTDYKLPGMSGLELCRELLARQVPLPLVLLTGTGTEHLAVQALKAGVDDYLIKDPGQGYLDLLPVVLPDVVRKYSDRLARQQAEEALRESEGRLRLLVQNMPVMIDAIDAEGNFVLWNRECEGVTGYSADEIIGNPKAMELLYPDLDRLERVTEEVAEHAADFRDFEWDIQCKESVKTVAWANISNQVPIPGWYQWAIGVDITERARAEEALRRRNRELALLNNASQAFTATLDLDQVLVTVLEEMRGLLDVTSSSVWLNDPETNELVCHQAIGPKSEAALGWRLAPGEGIAGWVARSGESLIVPDTRADKRHFKGVDQQIGLEMRSILSVPLQVKQNVVGVLQVVDTDVDRFKPTDLKLVESLAATAAIAIENAWLYQQLRNYAGQLEQRVQERTTQLQAQYARLEAILGSASDGIVVTDGQGQIIQANPVTQTWLTRTLSPEDATRLREAVRDLAMRDHERPESVLELMGLDLELTAAPISLPQPPPLAGGGREGRASQRW